MDTLRSICIDRGWTFGYGARVSGAAEGRTVDLPHDYMIEGDVSPDVPAGAASGYYTAGVAHYTKEITIPAEWAGERIFLRFDGAMMNATVEVNGAKACLQHYGYAPFETDITNLIYPGEKNRITVTVNPSMQPNSRWYSGAGLFRSVHIVHTPPVYLPMGGLSAGTRKLEEGPDGLGVTAFLEVGAEVVNTRNENRIVEAAFSLIREGTGETVIERKTLIQVPAGSAARARTTLTLDGAEVWTAEDPRLYTLRAVITEKAVYRTHMVPVDDPARDEDEVLFGIRTVEADVRHGLRINGVPVKLKGGCLHHDNGPIGAASLYDAEARKVRKLKEVGFNAIRTTHNPPSAALIEACDRLGMYVFDEAFDAWGMGKQPGDYNQYFDTDWVRDLTAFVKRDRCHPSVILWSTGNEITERAGLNDGYVLAAKLADTVRALDGSRPVSNGICSFWNGLDDKLFEAQMNGWKDVPQGGLQNADIGGSGDLMWERYTEAFASGLDIVGYNYLEDKYAQDHEMFPERVILGSENFPNQIGHHWPMIERTPWVIGDFTWTAWDYLGEAGIGKALFMKEDDPRLHGAPVPWNFGAPYPWRTANDADLDITGEMRPQGVYRSVVWGSLRTGLFSYDPKVFGLREVLTRWGFPGVEACWNWEGSEGCPVHVAVFSAAEEVELKLNGVTVGRGRAGMDPVHGMPCTFLFEVDYRPGTLEAVSLRDGCEVSRAALVTTGKPKKILLAPETGLLKNDTRSLLYVRALVTDDEGRVVPSARVELKAAVSGKAYLAGFGSGTPITEDNYQKGVFTSCRGQALAVLRAAGVGEARLEVTGEGLEGASVTVRVE